ncbi:CPBP family intramembrane metalloprotease [Erythrobacter sp. sf7]|uniref:CPBP family intramembrane metalloprotease n=1 Tax=Erythrobacter fulvus TaxID=2987523 RepID=A0ABT5JKT1_9SPHN|nr:CPBP family intramembrane glutamic endopeptidase [Erythrobacter fulvus]MDC8753184.1 CPBP family intramembrane metalloprotease [Erythrobacter fulvus]
MIRIRPNSSAMFAAIVLAGMLAVTIANIVFFSRESSVVWVLHFASNGWINANLTMFVPMTLLVIGGLVMAWGGQGLSDLGLNAGWALRLLLLLGAGWVAVQLLAAIVALVSGIGLVVHPAWAEHGAGTLVGLLLAMVLGTAPFEDGLFRGYVLPQLYLLMGSRFSGETERLIAALLLCSIIFALWHLPTILLNREVTLVAVAGALAYMFLGGVLLGLLYLRTGRLEVVFAGHALVNAPTLLVETPLPGSLLAGIVGLGAIIAGPMLAGRPWSTRLVRIVPR